MAVVINKKPAAPKFYKAADLKSFAAADFEAKLMASVRQGDIDFVRQGQLLLGYEALGLTSRFRAYITEQLGRTLLWAKERMLVASVVRSRKIKEETYLKIGPTKMVLLARYADVANFKELVKLAQVETYENLRAQLPRRNRQPKSASALTLLRSAIETRRMFLRALQDHGASVGANGKMSGVDAALRSMLAHLPPGPHCADKSVKSYIVVDLH
jgi:hypothetical protein